MKIRTKLLLSMSGIILLPAVIIGYSVYRLNKQALRNYVGVRLEQESRRGAGIIEDFFSGLERKISLINLISSSGKVEKEKALPFLMDLINNRPEIRGILLTQKNGNRISFGNIDKISSEPHSSSAYVKFLNGKKLDFVFSYPLPRLGGTVRGAGNLQDLIGKITGSNSLPENIIKLTAGGDVFKTADYPGAEEKVFYKSAKIRGLGWSLTYGLRRNVVFAPLKKFLLRTALIILAVLVLSFIVAHALSNNLTKPISALAEGAKNFAKGKFDETVRIKTKDEIGALGAAFNLMAREVNEYQKKLVSQERLAVIGRMAAVIGHELRNPLTAVSNACFYIRNKLGSSDMDPKILKHLSIMETETSRIKRIGGDMLSFARQRAAMMRPIDVEKLIDEVLESIEKPEGVAITKNIIGKVPQARGEYEEIKQVVVNIAENAKAAVGNPGRVTISASCGFITAEAGNPVEAVVISIKDDGCGIPGKIKNRIFEPFFSTRDGGTGLGLAVSKRIIEERHGGTIELESTENEGTEFTVKLPAWSEK